MDAGITTAATATGSTPGAQPAGLFGALAGAKAHGPMSGFQALLAAFFGHQGMGAQAGLAGAESAEAQGKNAFALKSDSKAGHTPMDDALNPTPKDGLPTDDKALNGAVADNVAANPGLSADAQALAALFAAPLQKAAPVEETTGKPPATQAGAKTAANANDAGVPAIATGLAAAETPAIDIVAAGADQAKTSAAPPADQAAVSTGRTKLVEFAEALAATRNGARAAAPKATDAQAGYQAPVAPTAAEIAAKAAPVVTPDTAAVVEAAAASPVAEVEVAEVELPSPGLGKDRAGVRTNRMDSARKDSAGQPLLVATDAAATAKPTVAIANPFTIQPGSASTVEDKSDKPEAAPLKVEAAADDATQAQAQAPAVSAHATPAMAQAATTAVRGAPETVASLAAQIIKKAEGRATRFDVELHPADLGRVDVRLEIGAHGRLTASMSFENPQAAAELRGRADELQRALENAGFDLSGGLSFDVAGDRGQNQNQPEQQSPDGGALRGRAFEAALATAGETANAALAGALNAYQSRVAPGLDIRI